MKLFRNHRMGLLLGAALPLVAASAGTAVAQDTGTGETATQQTAATGNDIIVTATRRPQTLLDVPLSVAVVSGDSLAKMGTRQFNDLQGSVPNLQIDQTNGNFVINMRGLGSGGGNLAFEQSVGFFVDGVYSGRSRSLQTAMMDVARVEVVRGPQGALFGKNTDAGAISVITAAPTRDFEGRVSAGYEFENQGWNAEGYLSGPITDNLSARFSAQGGHAGGYMWNRATKTDDNSNDYLGLRGQLLFEPMQGMSAKLKVEYGKNNYNGNNLAYNGLGASTNPVSNAIRAIDAPYGGAIETPSFTRIQSSPYGRGFSRTENWNVTLTTDTDLGGGVKLTTITGYQHIKARTNTDIDISPLTLVDNLHTESTTQLSEEARVSASIGKLSLIAGLQYYYAQSHIVQNVYWNNPGLALPLLTGNSILPFDQKSESISPFLAGNLEILPGLTIDGSVRYSDETKQARMQQLAGGPFKPYDIRGRRHEKLWDYSGKLSYKFNQRGQVYVSYATGSKGGGFVANDTQLGVTNKYQFDPERARSWEAGLKLRGEGGLYDLNLAVFNTNFDNLQVSSFNGVNFVTGNAAKVRSRGVELEGDLRPVSFFSVGGNVALLDAKYQSYLGPCIYNASCPLGYSDLSGYRLTRAPKWKWTAYAQVDAPLSDALQFSARGQVNYTGLTNYQDTQNPATMMPAYTTVDARVAVTNKAQGWDVAVVGRNLTNTISWSQAFGLPEISGATGVFINPGRTITLQVSKNF